MVGDSRRGRCFPKGDSATRWRRGSPSRVFSGNVCQWCVAVGAPHRQCVRISVHFSCTPRPSVSESQRKASASLAAWHDADTAPAQRHKSRPHATRGRSGNQRGTSSTPWPARGMSIYIAIARPEPAARDVLHGIVRGTAASGASTSAHKSGAAMALFVASTMHTLVDRPDSVFLKASAGELGAPPSTTA